jgi:ATP-binding protein involved in chromosome partitioning
MPRKTGAVQKRSIPNVTKVLAVASGKGGVGKSTVAGNFIVL